MAKKEMNYFTDNESIKSKAKVMRLMQVKEEAPGSPAPEEKPAVMESSDALEVSSPEIESVQEEKPVQEKKSRRGRKSKEKNIKGEPVRFFLSREVHVALRRVSIEEGKTFSDLAMDAFTEYFKKYYPKSLKTDLL